VQDAEDLLKLFASDFPRKTRFSGGRDFHGLREAGRTRLHPLLELWQFLGEAVFAFGLVTE